MLYSFKCYPVDIEGESLWFAESLELKGCAGQGKTCAEAVYELERNEKIWLEMQKEDEQ